MFFFYTEVYKIRPCVYVDIFLLKSKWKGEKNKTTGNREPLKKKTKQKGNSKRICTCLALLLLLFERGNFFLLFFLKKNGGGTAFGIGAVAVLLGGGDGCGIEVRTLKNARKIGEQKKCTRNDKDATKNQRKYL